MRIGPDPEREFRIEGTFYLVLDEETARDAQEHRRAGLM